MNSRRQTVFEAARQTTAAVRYPHETCERRKFRSDGSTYANKVSKTEQLLIIDPPCELEFKGPFTKPVRTFMILKNLSYKKVAFKIRTNEPKLYNLSQICGILAPQQQAKILVLLKPFGYDANERNEHMFLVKAVVIDRVTDYGEDGKTFQWRDIKESRIVNTKLNCSFEMLSVEQLLETENIDEDTTNVFEVNAETEIQKAATEVEELREEKNTRRQEYMTLRNRVLYLSVST